jgi:hypothetical protein
MGVHLMGVHLMGVHLMGVHLTGVYLTGMHVTGVYLMACISRLHGYCRTDHPARNLPNALRSNKILKVDA